jgi:hypothetical protein
MQVFGFGKRRPAANNGVPNAPNGYNQNPSPASPVKEQTPPFNGYSASPALMRSPFEESPVENKTPVAASVRPASCVSNVW